MLNKSHAELRSQAHWQIEAMCDVMLKAAQAEDCDTLPYLVQSLAIRINALNGAMMLAVGNVNTGTIGALRGEVRGPGSYAGGSYD
jgi:hypothetical protein